MSLLNLPGLGQMVEVISKERNLPKHAVQNALREALLKGYERFRKTYRSDGINFEEEHFNNFDVPYHSAVTVMIKQRRLQGKKWCFLFHL